MFTLEARNVNQALPEGIRTLEYNSEFTSSRAGKVYSLPAPMIVQYDKPKERVLFHPLRDANPFFHLMESIWMLAGRNDVAWLDKYNSRMKDFSDDGVLFHGAYGFRWRREFGFDQLPKAIELLKRSPNTRRCVVGIWNPHTDLVVDESSTKDIPCNTQVMFRIVNNELNMTVTNRSNDMIWGAFGANAVHFSILQEYVASHLEIPVGKYWQITNNMHAYEELFLKLRPLISETADGYSTQKLLCPYSRGEAKVFPLINYKETWDAEAKQFMVSNWDSRIYNNKFFYEVAIPMAKTYAIFKDKSLGSDRYQEAIDFLSENMVDCDWQIAGVQWLKRRKQQFEEKNSAS